MKLAFPPLCPVAVPAPAYPDETAAAKLGRESAPRIRRFLKTAACGSNPIAESTLQFEFLIPPAGFDVAATRQKAGKLMKSPPLPQAACSGTNAPADTVRAS
jgi:hypothetical protein